MNPTERIGVSVIQNIVYRDLKWSFREQPIDDVGIDALVEIFENNKPTGKLIGLQIKSGASYFKTRKGSSVVFRTNDQHRIYWANCILPVIIVLYNPDTEECIWEAAENIDKTNKLLVPTNQTFSIDSKENIKNLAYRSNFDKIRRDQRFYLEQKSYLDNIGYSSKQKYAQKENCLVLDFGSSRTMVGYVGESEVIEPFLTAGQKNYFDSVLGFDKNYQITFGEEALRQARDGNTIVIRNFKRELGTGKLYKINEISLSVEEIVILFLIKILNDIALRFEIRFNTCILAIPNDFSSEQRQAYRRCIEACGLTIKRILQETDCTAINEYVFINNTSGDYHLLSIDIGGGTTDVSLAEMGDEVVEILASNGDKRLGGFDYDEIVQQYLLRILKSDFPDILVDDYLLSQIDIKAEDAKLLLNTMDLVSVPLHNCYDLKEQCRTDCLITINRENFSREIAPLNDKVMKLIDQTFKDENFNPQKEEFRINIGGAGGNINSLQQIIRNKYPGKIIYADKKDKSVFQGLGLQASKLNGKSIGDKFFLLAVANCDIQICGESFWTDPDDKQNVEETQILDKDITIPTKRSITVYYSISQEFQIIMEVGKQRSILYTLNQKCDSDTEEHFKVTVDIDHKHEMNIVIDIDACESKSNVINLGPIFI